MSAEGDDASSPGSAWIGTLAVVSTTLECQSCGAALMLTAHERTARCLYCASPSVIARPPSPDRPDPRFVLGFVVPPERALAIATRWLKRPLLAPEAFRSATPSDIRGLYLPAYVYTGAAHSQYSAQIGENYTVTETYTTTVNGKTVVRTRTRVETEWRSLSGQHATYVHDRVVTASRGIPNAELEAIEPFDLRALHRYTPKVISGWVAEEPSLSQGDCYALARQEAIDEVGRLLTGFMPGDRHRNLQYRTQLTEEHLALALLPVWVLAVRYAPDAPVVRLLVNGQTGKLHGRAPRSTLKIVILVLTLVALIALPFLIVFVTAAVSG
jgi:hypothetical protein